MTGLPFMPLDHTVAATAAAADDDNDAVGSAQNSLTWKEAALSLFLFILAGICEIGGGYLVWRGVKQRGSSGFLFVVMGSAILIVYGFVPTFQPSDNFGRVYAVYGGFFIVLSYCWTVLFDHFVPDTGDYLGGCIALVG
eukprot:CAMPEP_0185031060 /NCGR_PEP_ID=MMETSP1103-20130426/18305_1 /TAXON_ID=36769 /ORGANISM="Paraphysomonas bandaiensis, Strain Caron Lab Isolate" /LENGTH=138 /DNA_ID=CAMNT_0027566429 /DNA_START=32 /DNA_END=444 /DNA_ORIENTATION=+